MKNVQGSIWQDGTEHTQKDSQLKKHTSHCEVFLYNLMIVKLINVHLKTVQINVKDCYMW